MEKIQLFNAELFTVLRTATDVKLTWAYQSRPQPKVTFAEIHLQHLTPKGCSEQAKVTPKVPTPPSPQPNFETKTSMIYSLIYVIEFFGSDAVFKCSQFSTSINSRFILDQFDEKGISFLKSGSMMNTSTFLDTLYQTRVRMNLHFLYRDIVLYDTYSINEINGSLEGIVNGDTVVTSNLHVIGE